MVPFSVNVKFAVCPTVFDYMVYLCRRHGYRTRIVTPKRPPGGYFTDSTSMSGADANDASDAESRDEGVYQFKVSQLYS